MTRSVAAIAVLLGLAPLACRTDSSGQTFLESVSMNSATEGWAVGSFDFNQGGSEGVTWHYHTGAWREQS